MSGPKELTPVLIRSQPGIKRDGTQLEGKTYTDALWCRFQRGLPRKMAGFRSVTSTLPGRVYGMHVYNQNAVQYAHLGSASLLTQILMDSFGNLTGQSDRTPVGFAASPNNTWMFDVLFDDTGAGVNQLIAHAGQNLAAIDSTVETPIYIGNITANTALVASAMDPQSGGVVVLAPFLLTYGNFGRVDISNEADPTTQLSSANPVGTKVIKGLPLRGNGGGPSGLFWSLDSVFRATFDATLTPFPFAFDTLTTQSSILSSRSVIDYNGVFYWLGVDRAMMFNGVVQDLPNDYNTNWFYDNLNFAQRQKVFAFKVPKFGEIWWCYPRGNATECTDAIIYNVNSKYWYDTALPTLTQAGMGRSDGFYAQVYSKPFMCDLQPTDVPGDTNFTLWQHETGTDSINASNIQPIRSYFKTSELTMMSMEQSVDAAMRVTTIEPDFVQSGELTVTVEGRQNARAPDVVSDSVSFPAVAATPDQQTVPVKVTRRLMAFKFESNVAGGNYEMGDTYAHIGESDGRQRG